MFHSKLKKRVKNLEKGMNDLAYHCGTFADFYEDGEEAIVGDGMRLGDRNGPLIKMSDVVRAVVNHLGLDIGVKAIKQPPKKQQGNRSKK